MNEEKLRSEVELELDSMAATLDELQGLLRDVEGRTPTMREKMAAGGFLMNLYGGLERILRRLARHHGTTTPTGPRWHAELTEMFTQPLKADAPALLDHEFSEQIRPFREFRHVVVHGYGLTLDWEEMLPGVRSAQSVFEAFGRRVRRYLALL